MDGVQMRDHHEREQLRERLAAGRDEALSAEERSRQNRDFVQVYSKGWARMRALVKDSKSQGPILLYTFLAEHIDADGGVLVVDQDTICEAIGVSRTTLWRACKFLEDQNALLRLQVGGSVYAYALDPTEVWRSWDSAKERAVFATKTMVRKSAQGADVARRMQIMLKDRAREAELELDHDPDAGEAV